MEISRETKVKLQSQLDLIKQGQSQVVEFIHLAGDAIAEDNKASSDAIKICLTIIISGDLS